jgi:hypothetical protein
MPQVFKIDQAASFTHVMFLSAEPKTKFGTSDQECTKDGTPKWDVQVVAGFNQFGKATNEVLKVGVAAGKRPGEGLPPATPVHLIGFEVGVMAKTSRDGTVIGAQVWYRCDEVRPIAAPSKG